MGRNNITILNKSQQDAMRKVCRLAREVLDIAAREIKPGITTDYLDQVVHQACLERDVSTIPVKHWLLICLYHEFPLTSLVLSITFKLCSLPEISMHITE